MERKRQKEISKLMAGEREGKTQQTDVFPDRLAIDKFRQIWNDERVEYSDEQLFKIREWLYAMCNAALSVAEQQFDNRNQIIGLKTKSNEAEESNFIYPCEYRRAS